MTEKERHASCVVISEETFFIRTSLLNIPKGDAYTIVELVLRYSESSHRLAGGAGTFWRAIDKTFDRAFERVCKAIKDQLEDFEGDTK
jgi:hypothetical protein